METVILNSSKEKKQVFSPDLSVRPISSDLWSYVLLRWAVGTVCPSIFSTSKKLLFHFKCKRRIKTQGLGYVH